MENKLQAAQRRGYDVSEKEIAARTLHQQQVDTSAKSTTWGFSRDREYEKYENSKPEKKYGYGTSSNQAKKVDTGSSQRMLGGTEVERPVTASKGGRPTGVRNAFESSNSIF